MNRLRRLLANEDGVAMAMVVGMIVVLTVLAVVLIDQVTNETKSAAGSSTSNDIYQAAEAGINDYIAKMTEDPAYYDHCVAKGESTRKRKDTSALVAHSVDAGSCEPGNASAWPSSVKWTYPNNKDWWYAGTGDASDNTAISGYAYDLMITPPHGAVGSIPGTDYTDIVSTGCKVQDSSASPLQCDSRFPQRAIEVHTRITTPADFQYMMNSMDHTSSDDVCWASTIYGSMYSTGDIYVCGATFYGNVLAEGRVVVAGGYSNPPNVVLPSKIYTPSTTPDIRSIIKNKIIISDIVGSVSQIQTNAEMNTNLRTGSSTTGVGMAFDDTSASAWRLNFTSNGNVQVWKCVNSTLPEKNEPYCNDVKLTANATLKSSSATTMAVDQSTGVLTQNGSALSGSFPASCTGTCGIYVGSGATWDKVTYTGRTDTTFTGVTCSACGSTGHSHLTGETVSIVSGGLPGPVPAYNGPVPSNGAIYTGQDAVISWPTAIKDFSATSNDGSPTSQVNGRVTVASATDILIGGDVHYASESSSDGIGGANDDVLGLIAQNNITFPQYAPLALWWRAATVAVSGAWGDYACQNGPDRGNSSSMTFVGTATYGSNTGCMHSPSGGYGYNSGGLKNVYRITDDGTAPSCPSTAPLCATYTSLKYLNPPWFPPLNGIETVLFREVPAGYIPAAAP